MSGVRYTIQTRTDDDGISWFLVFPGGSESSSIFQDDDGCYTYLRGSEGWTCWSTLEKAADCLADWMGR